MLVANFATYISTQLAMELTKTKTEYALYKFTFYLLTLLTYRGRSETGLVIIPVSDPKTGWLQHHIRRRVGTNDG